MLTPLEIENRKFKKEFQGYSKVEVTEFLSVISENYELIYKENLANKDKINMLSNAIKQYKSMEETLQSSIVIAKSTGDEIIQNAKKSADNIIKDAENKAAQLLADASREVTRVSYEYEDMRRNVEVFRTKIISLLTSQLDIVKEFNVPKDELPKKTTKLEPKHIELDNDTVDAASGVLSTLEKLEQVTMELPKIDINEKGEYIEVKTDEPEDKD
ncbi:MAG: DivIVA domain-containing protein [Clostridia bacterium]|nr:DivIVA domain-containing protein [Oscillospiraceae bacterium]MBQ7960512.1 DivIVA domain-containing protein [Clostridia bacterium]